MQQDFLSRLQEQARQQALLHQKRLLPPQVDVLTAFIGKYPWQIIGALALVGAVVWEWWL